MSFYCRFWPLLAIFLVCLVTTGLESRFCEAAGSMYVVEAEAALLRDYPSPDSGILTRLDHSDQVEYLDANASGWWKVRSLRTGVVGWMTSDLLAAAPPKLPLSIPTKTEYSYVNTPSIDLRVIPLHSSATTGTVQLNDRVEKLGFLAGRLDQSQKPTERPQRLAADALFVGQARFLPCTGGANSQKTGQACRSRQEKAENRENSSG